MYSPRRRRYNNYRYRIQKYYAPTIQKSPIPNYYQKKGRILQVSPLRLVNENTNLINQKLLDRYYQTLVKYKYPFPDTPIPPSPQPPIDISQYTYFIHTDYVQLSALPEIIDNEYIFNTYVSSTLETLPPAPTGFEYYFDLISITYAHTSSNQSDNSNFSLSWSTPLAQQTHNLITKTLTGTYNTTDYYHIMAFPGASNYVFYSQASYTQTSINYRMANFGSPDANINDDGIYPLLSTDNGSETYNSSIGVSKSNVNDRHSFQFHISIYLKSNEY